MADVTVVTTEPLAGTRRVEPDMGRVLACELLATAVLVLIGPGSAILVPGDFPAKMLLVALAFGFAITIGILFTSSIGGAHINPAVTLGFLTTKKIPLRHAIYAWIGQFVGGIFGAAIILGIASGKDGFDRGNFAANGWNKPFGADGALYGLGAAIVVEIVFTALLVLVALSTTHRRFPFGFGGLAVGLTVAIIHMVTIPVDNTSVNPARSLATAIFATGDSDALKQVWAFLVFPMVGAIVGVIAYLLVDDARLEDTVFDTEVLRDIRDAADDAID